MTMTGQRQDQATGGRRGGRRLALRLARRTARRNPLFALLVVLVVAAPIAAATAADLYVRTSRSNPDSTQMRFGAADAVLTPPGNAPAAALPELPEGSRTVAVGEVAEAWHYRLIPPGTIRVLPVGDPLTHHLARLMAGEAPDAPGEAAVSRSRAGLDGLLDTRGLPTGARVKVQGVEYRVTGLVEEPSCFSCPLTVLAPGSTLKPETDPQTYADEPRYRVWVDLPRGTDRDELRAALADTGWESRERGQTPVDGARRLPIVDAPDYPLPNRVDLVALLVGVGLLEVVLLAGAAFAIAARRQARELGLIAAQGGDRRIVRRVLLAQGLVLGAAGTAVGIAAGCAVMAAGRPHWEREMDQAIVAWGWGPLELAAIAAAGVGAAVAAALRPAVGAARRPTLDALAGRFPLRARPRRLRSGVLLVGAGVAVAALGTLALRGGAEIHGTRNGDFVGSDAGRTPAVILLGAVLVAVGLTRLVPAALARLAGHEWRLPPAARLALRDAVRNRHRTGPAVGAIATAVAVGVATSLLAAGAGHAAEVRTGLSSQGTVWIDRAGDRSEAIAQAVADELPDARVLELARVETADDAAPRRVLACAAPDCAPGGVGLYVGGVDVVTALSEGLNDPAGVQAALDAGKVVLIVPDVGDELTTAGISIQGTSDRKRLPAVRGADPPDHTGPRAVISAAGAAAQGWRVVPYGHLVVHAGATVDQRAAAAVAGEGFAGEASAVYVRADGIADVVTLATAAAAVIGVALPIALSAAEGRADQATYAAVGVAPRRRRWFAVAQALLLAVVGTALGLALGAGFAALAWPATRSVDLVVRWNELAALAAAAPALAVLLGLAFAARRPVLTRRAD